MSIHTDQPAGTELSTERSTRRPPLKDRLVTGSPWPAVAAIWLSASGLAVWSPDMISGSEQEHLPLGLITVWLWAAAATAYALMTPRRGSLAGWTLAVVGLWFVTLLVGLFAPELVTGTDPTRIPLAVLVAPPVAALVTGMLSLHEAGRQLDDES